MTRTISMLWLALGLALVPALARAEDGPYLGRLSTNRYTPQSIGNPYGPYGSPTAPRSVVSPNSIYGSSSGPQSANNPYAVNTPRIYASDGRYLGKLSSNPYDPESISNPYGKYGSTTSPTSVNNRYGVYGSTTSPRSANNPYAVDAPRVYGAPKPTYTSPSYGVPSYTPRTYSVPPPTYGRFGDR